MRSTFHGIEVAKRSLFAQQTAVNTTGHNIANANTQGYSRQNVNLSATRALDPISLNRTTIPGQIGQGVDVAGIQRVRDTFVDTQYRNESQSLGELEVQQEALSKIEAIFNEPSESGLSAVTDAFFASWHDLSRNPDDLTARSVVRESAIAMLDGFKSVDNQLATLKNDLESNREMKIKEANVMLGQLDTLNKEISKLESSGVHQANDLRDKRDLLTDQLSSLMKINVKEQPNGYYHIALGNGQTVLDTDGPKTIGESVATENIDMESIVGGEIGGLTKAINEIVPKYQEQLEALVEGALYGEMSVTIPAGSTLADGTSYAEDTVIQVNGINGLHQLGWTLNDGAVGGVSLFSENFTSIQDLELHPDVMNNLANIASSMRIENLNGQDQVLKGNGEIALAIGQLRDAITTYTTSDGKTKTGTFEDNYRSMIGELGVQAQEMNRRVESQDSIVMSVSNRRDSIIGVSLDEEMANLIKFQHAYSASARVMTAVDEILDQIINGMGRVGR